MSPSHVLVDINVNVFPAVVIIRWRGVDDHDQWRAIAIEAMQRHICWRLLPQATTY